MFQVPTPGKDCVFPFYDKGIKYDKTCAKSHPRGKLWCKTDPKEAKSEEFKSWGYCHSACDEATSNLNSLPLCDI